MHTGIIFACQVSSRASYVVYGRVRGLVAECRSSEAARRALVRDQLGCQKQGGYSDAAIYEWGVGGWAGAPGAPSRAAVGRRARPNNDETRT